MNFRAIIPGLLLLLASCGSRSQTIPSPDSSMVMVTSIEQSKGDPGAYHCVIFEIHDRQGQVIFKENTRASGHGKWSLSWAGTNRIKLDSADIGIYFWSQGPDNHWRKEP